MPLSHQTVHFTDVHFTDEETDEEGLSNIPKLVQLVELEMELKQPVFLKTTKNCRQMPNPSIPIPPPPKARIYSLMGTPLF